MVGQKQKRAIARRGAAVIFIALLSVTAGSALAQTRQPPASSLQDLHSLNELREAFNHDAGKIRLILLLSPT